MGHLHARFESSDVRLARQRSPLVHQQLAAQPLNLGRRNGLQPGQVLRVPGQRPLLFRVQQLVRAHRLPHVRAACQALL